MMLLARSRFVRVVRGSLVAVSLAASVSMARAAEADGVVLPDQHVVDGAELHLNGVGTRTYSWLRIRIYVAGLYLEHLTHDAAAILQSSERKLIDVQFLHDVDAERARDAWREGFERNCRSPCHLDSGDVARFLDNVTGMKAGDHSLLVFTPTGLDIRMNGRSLGRITDRTFAWAVLATFIGPDPPTDRLKSGLLGLAQ